MITFNLFHPQEASVEVLTQVHELKNVVKKELFPAEKAISFSETCNAFNTPIPSFDFYYWTATEETKTQIVGFAKAGIKMEGENDHLIWFEIFILPNFRRRGIGREFFSLIGNLARNNHKKMLTAHTWNTVPDADYFMQSMGGTVGSSLSISQLNMHTLNHQLIDEWIRESPHKNFSVGVWIGAYPEEEIDSVIQVKEAMNAAPRGELKIENTHCTVEQLRQMEQFYTSRNVERWTIYAKDNLTSTIVGFSEVFWHPSEPNVMIQGDTAVLPHFKGKNIAKWLKSQMIQKIDTERKEIEFLRTANAVTNEAMLGINRKLGYQLYQGQKIWQFIV